MLILVTYDVHTTTAVGRKRLREVSKVCVNYGQRVQNSVFECDVDSVLFCQMKAKLLHLIDPEKDSLRFYHLGNQYRKHIEHYGANPAYDPEGILIV